MSEKLLKFLLEELKTVRVTCKRCKVQRAIETTVDRMDSVLDGVRCRFCNSELFSVTQQQNYLRDLQFVLGELARLKADLEIEFVLPDKG